MPDPSLAKKCVNWSKFNFGDFDLVNNPWRGVEQGRTDFTQCIYHGNIAGVPRCQWTWDWPYIGNDDVYAYPEIIYGWKPWDAFSTTTKLPRQLSAINSIPTTYEIAAAGTGIFNTAFDLWITTGATPTADTIKSEVMIWVGNQDLTPASSIIDTVPATFGSFDLYRDAFPNWTYYAFVLDTPLPAASTDLNGLLQFMIAKGYADPTHYLASIEFGTEIANGTGEADLKQFSVDVT
ncbi:MAG: hypothetical protein K8T89_13970 [Planctomycetes bacterium]|nr:hypothetical protein [Planctomycetota bacterium]